MTQATILKHEDFCVINACHVCCLQESIEQPEQAAGQAALLQRTVTLNGWGTPPADTPPTGSTSPAAVQQGLPKALAQRELELELELETEMDFSDSTGFLLGAATSSWTGASGQGQAGSPASGAQPSFGAPALPSPPSNPFAALAAATPSPFARPVPQPAAQEPKIDDTEMLQDASEEFVDIDVEVDEEMLPAPEISAGEHSCSP
jgi:hypothetical protein